MHALIMRVIRHVSEAGPPRRPRVLAVGTFDGLHRGHGRVLAQLAVWARALGAEAVVLADRPQRTVPRLMDLHQWIERMRDAAVDTIVFTDRAARMQAVRPLAPALLVSGSDALSVPGSRCERVADVDIDGTRIDAATVRQALAAGDIPAVRALLGRDPAIGGRVVHGFHRGAPLGIPTANLRVRGVQLPPDGVYAVRAQVSGTDVCGVANIGFNPTFGNQMRSVETHLLDFNDNVYGRRLVVAFVARLRGEHKFAGIDALLAQIRADIAAARALLASR
jgi:riboflavin kinase/FMN adenylyltransferase